MAQQITLQELYSAKASVKGRLARLKQTSVRFNWHTDEITIKSPIAKIDAFQEDIEKMENILKKMQNRLDNAKITIKI